MGSQGSCTDGAYPRAGLILDATGNLYGTTSYGGVNGYGVGAVFELTPNPAKTTWTETVLHSFCAETDCADGERPQQAGVIMDAAGNLYGYNLSTDEIEGWLATYNKHGKYGLRIARLQCYQPERLRVRVTPQLFSRRPHLDRAATVPTA